MEIISEYVGQITNLGWFFIILTTCIFILSVIYGVGYLHHYKATNKELTLHWGMFALCYVGMMGLYSTQSMLWFLVGWELMALGSFMSVIFEAEKPVVLKAGMNYFVQSHIGVLFITAAFVWVYSVTDRMDFNTIPLFIESLTETQQVVWMMLLVSGFGFKAGLIPFHSWLPHAHPAAPSHISAAMSGVIVKAGVYGVIRFGSYMTMGHTTLGAIVLILAILSALYGIINAADGRDFKRILAYCTIENVGIIFAGIGVAYIAIGEDMTALAYLGLMAALFHTLNHAIFKVMLFFAAGNVYVSTHTRDIDRLGGMLKIMPQSGLLFLIAAIGIGGLPPFGGFISEMMLYSGFLKGMAMDSLPLSILMVLSGASLAVVGGASMLCFTKTFGVIFLGVKRDEEIKPHLIADKYAEQNSMTYPIWLLVPVVICIVAFPSVLCALFMDCVKEIYSINMTASEVYSITNSIDVLQSISLGALILITTCAVLGAIRVWFMRRRPMAEGPTWGCGYMKPIRGIQYTGQSFSGTLAELFSFVLPKTRHYEPIQPEEIFPKHRTLLNVSQDAIEKGTIMPLADGVVHFLQKFQWLMNGQLQRYIIYGFISVLLLVIAAIIF
ncbi:MAG: proton-conducting transporter membrane subunit [Bacteroidia bacterium]|nr:proton-conducting transporter membrane subunit [Bacteroidia bacterium]